MRPEKSYYSLRYVALDMWIDFALNHIVQKVAGLPKDYLGGSSADVTREEFIRFRLAAKYEWNF